jgi:predicted tellurium resistance membrane protein TerC
MDWMTDPNAWLALATLTALEIVLGIDNIIFIAILAGRLPAGQQARARTVGLALAMLSRIGLLFCLTLIMRLTAPLITVLGEALSGRDLILIVGGLFLLAKSTLEIHDKLEGPDSDRPAAGRATFGAVVFQILLLDIVFSLDSVITAIGLVQQLAIMVIAIVIAVVFMMVFVGPLSRFVEHNPTIKILALSFLLLIGMALVGEGLDLHIPKGYIYFAMAFSVFVEMLNLKIRRRERAPVHLRQPHRPQSPAGPADHTERRG